MAYSNLIREEKLKNKIASDFFSSYDTTPILGNVDFCVAQPLENASIETQYFLWAEAKKGDKSILDESITQLILTIGKARTFEKHLPPTFIGAFDASKIGFIPYSSIHEIFYMNDFNWNVTPSDHTTKEFLKVLDIVKNSMFNNVLAFDFDKDKKELEKFIRANFKLRKKRITRIKISKNNFVVIYQKWLKEVKPTIDVDWDAAKNEEETRSAIEKAKMQFARYSEKQFESYNSLWKILLYTKHQADMLWDKPEPLQIPAFSEQIRLTKDAINDSLLLIEEEHYEKLMMLIEQFEQFQFGKIKLIDIRGDLSKNEGISLEETRVTINQNKATKDNYNKLILDIGKSFRTQLKG